MYSYFRRADLSLNLNIPTLLFFLKYNYKERRNKLFRFNFLLYNLERKVMSEIQTNSPIVQEKCFIHEQDTTIVPLSKEDVLVPGIADKHPRDMPEMAFVIAFCIQYNEAVGNLNFLPEELEDAIVRREPVDLVERIHRYFFTERFKLSKDNRQAILDQKIARALARKN
ncbi:unnamed protein product [Rhizophagus irregularis]|nr:unnamed protein product [Rhizophagus irregularis]